MDRLRRRGCVSRGLLQSSPHRISRATVVDMKTIYVYNRADPPVSFPASYFRREPNPSRLSFAFALPRGREPPPPLSPAPSAAASAAAAAAAPSAFLAALAAILVLAESLTGAGAPTASLASASTTAAASACPPPPPRPCAQDRGSLVPAAPLRGAPPAGYPPSRDSGSAARLACFPAH